MLHRIGYFTLVTTLLTLLCVPTLAQDSTQIEVDPADFVTVIDNPYFPRIPGMKWVYEGRTSNGELERVELEILTETRVVMGVQTTIMRDTVTIDGEVVEDTYDWFAQDRGGDVWYFGEDVSDYEDGQLVSKAGSWEAGVDGALPGIVMFGDLAAHIGETYLQEYAEGEAEDTAILLNINGSASVPYGEFDQVVLTYDFTPLDPDAHEIKYYARGVGEIKAIDLVTGDTIVLIEFAAP